MLAEISTSKFDNDHIYLCFPQITLALILY